MQKKDESLSKNEDDKRAKAIAIVMDEEIISDAEMEMTEGGADVTNNCQGGNCVAGCGSPSEMSKPGTATGRNNTIVNAI